MIEQTAEAWIPTGNGYEIRIDGRRANCRKVGGVPMGFVPSEARYTDAGQRVWRLKHEAEETWLDARGRVEGWMCCGHRLPRALLTALWPDRAWREWLDGAFLTGPDGGRGFLRGAGPDGLRLTTPDGDDIVAAWDAAVIAHPVLLGDLDALRESAAKLGIGQKLHQMARDVHRRPPAPEGDAVMDYAGRRFTRQRYAWQYYYGLAGGYAYVDLVSGGRPVQARHWIGAGKHDDRAWSGHLVWVGADERFLSLAEVDAVAWSEGVRLAELVHDHFRHAREGRGELVREPWAPIGAPTRPPGPAAALAAGLLPLGAEEGVPVRPRSYRHPLRGGEPVVRLVDDDLAPALDAWLVSRGFGEPEVGAPVGRGVAAEPLYPLWAVVHDPRRAGDAFRAMNGPLALYEEFSYARQHPEHFKPAVFLKDVKEYARRVPRGHLPAFWEKVGRMALRSGNARLVRQIFDCGREAEKALEVVPDVEGLGRLYAEIAPHGGLKPTALTAYARRLKGKDPAAAHAEVWRLVLRSAGAGVAPVPAVLPLLAGFARAAGLPPEEVDGPWRVLLSLPAAAQVPESFWAAAEPALRAAAGRCEPVAEALAASPEGTPPGSWWRALAAGPES
ncbi:DUF4132 domain-containing protein [Actinocorallia aurea]